MIPEKVAVISAVPIAKVMVARPLEPGVLLMFATFVEELHITDVVKSCVLLSEKCPIAVNCSLTMPEEVKIVNVAGLTSIDSSTTGVTVRVVDPEKPPELAVIVVEPVFTDVARPLEPNMLLIVAIFISDEFHVADEEISCVETSEKVPMAMNCWVFPRTILGFTGVTVIAVITSGVTPSVAGRLVMLVNDAKMVVVPSLTAVAKPALLIVAIPIVDEDHVATLVKDCSVKSAK